MNRDRTLDTNLWMIVWGIIGARVLHLIADGHFHDYVNLCVNPEAVPAIDAKVATCTQAAQCGYDYLCSATKHICYPPKDCLAALEIWRGGLAYYGGFLFAVAFAVYYTRKHESELGLARTADLAAPGIMLGLFWGRLGCFLNGCCYGKPTDSWIGIVFPQRQVRVHPTQLYESAACFAIFAFLYYVVRPRRRGFGDVFAAMLILYGIARSVIEIWRDDDRGVLFGWLSTSMIISIPLIAGGLMLLLRNRSRARV
jgi:phosphatidylglycerol---prolipoprotein diacylglyceryl transferase